MRTFQKIILVPAILLGIFIMTLNIQAAEKAEKTAKAEKTKKVKKAKKGKLQHVVSFKFKESASQEQIDELVTAFGALQGRVKEIKAYEWGTNVSPEKHDKGFTHCFIVTFKTEKDRDSYLVDPAHLEFVTLVGPIVEDVFVVDFWSQK